MKRPCPALRCARVVAVILASAAMREAAASSWTGHAVLVGVADYQGHVDDLYFADDDAEDVRDTLLLDADHWSESNIQLILNSDATFDEIRAAVDTMRTATATTDDVCVFFFSGHGDYWLDAPPYDEPDGEDEVLVAYDLDIYDDDLAAWLSGFTTQRVCVIIDTCYAGGMAKSSGGFSAADWVAGMAADIARVRPTGITKSPAAGTSRRSVPAPVPGTKDIDDLGTVNVVALMACEDVEAAEEDVILRNGVFTFYVVEAMRRLDTDTNGDTFTSAEEIFAYASEPTFLWNPMQTPFLFDSDPDPQRQVPVIAAAERYVEPIVTEGDLPFGGGIKAGCLPVRASRTQTGPASHSGPLGWLAVLAAALGVVTGRRRASAAVWLLALAAGCFHPYPSARHGYVKAGRAVPESADRSPPRAAAVEARPSGAGPHTSKVRPAGAGPHTSKVRPAGAPSVMPVARDADTDRFFLGVRAGALVPLGSRNAPYSETVQAGLFAAGKLWNMPLEVGLDFCRLESRGTDITADVLSGRVDVIAVRGVRSDDHENYYHFGPRILVDFVRSKTYWDGTSEVAAALGAGVGIRRRGGGWDARFSIDGLVGSFNIAGLLKLNAGFRF